MTQEEFERKLDEAANGDEVAALDVGDHLIKVGTADSIDLALFWYKKAIDNGSVLGVLKAMAVHKVKATVAKACFDLDAMEAYIGEIYDLYSLIPQDEKWPSFFADGVQEIYAYANYLLAFVKFEREDYTQAITLLDEIDVEKTPTPLAHILMGCCCFSIRQIANAHILLSSLERSTEKVVSASEDDMDQFLLAKAFGYLSIILRIGEKNIQGAYNVLKKGSELLTNEDCKGLLLTEMAHYRPKLFGGLQYV